MMQKYLPGPNFEENHSDNWEPEQVPLPANPAMQLLCSVCSTQLREPTGPMRRKRRTCKVVVDGQPCPLPDTCPGRVNNENCFLHTGGDPDKKLKRKIASRIKLKMCRVCGVRGCKGSEKRFLCENGEQVRAV